MFSWNLWASYSRIVVFLDLRLALQKKIYRLCFTWTYLSRSDIFMLFQLISFNLQFHTYLYAVCIQLVEFLVPRFRFLTILYLIWHQLILFCTYIVIFHHDPSRYNVSFWLMPLRLVHLHISFCLKVSRNMNYASWLRLCLWTLANIPIANKSIVCCSTRPQLY